MVGWSKVPLRIQEGVTSSSATAMTDDFLSLVLRLVTEPADWLGGFTIQSLQAPSFLTNQIKGKWPPSRPRSLS